MGPPFPTAGILVILPELCAKLNASFQYLPEIKFAFKTAIQPGTEAHRMGKKNNRAAGKWYANREVVPGKRDKQANILPVAETGI